jgi:hypothetical protein
MKKGLLLSFWLMSNAAFCNEGNSASLHDERQKLQNAMKKLCDDYFGTNEEILKKYQGILIQDYEKALIETLSSLGDTEALQKKFHENREKSIQEEKEKNNNLDDSKPGWFNWWPSLATDDSVKGLLQKQWKDLKQEQDKANEMYNKTYVQHAENFNAHVRPAMLRALAERRSTLFTRYAHGLDECSCHYATDDIAGLKACLKRRDISWKKLQDPDFLDKQDRDMEEVIYGLIKPHAIPLSPEKMHVIVSSIMLNDANTPDIPEHLKNKPILQQIEAGEKVIREKVGDILNSKNPSKRINVIAEDKEELSLDCEDAIKHNQNRQNELSQ